MLSLSKRAKRAQYNDLRTRGYRHEEAVEDVRRTDEMIIAERKRRKELTRLTNCG